VRRVVVLVAALLLSVGLSTSFALPAFAANGGPGVTVGCSAGSNCQISLQQLINVTGDHSPGSNGYVPIPPPPCVWVLKGNAITGSKYIIGLYGSNPTKAPQQYQIPEAVSKSDKMLKMKHTPPGSWYFLQMTPGTSAAGQAYCETFPAYEFGTSMPAINIPNSTITDYALAGLDRPEITGITVNPAKVSNVNLPTYVTATVGLPAAGTTRLINHNKQLYIAATAYVTGQPSVTIWAVSTPLRIQGGAQQEHNYSSCPGHITHVAGRTAMAFGTQATGAQMAKAGVGSAIDCGVTYLAPSSPIFDLQASLGWNVCWAMTGRRTFPPLTPPSVCQHPIPGGLRPSSLTKAVTVQEIQSTNGG
jgi:hypothetical protein